MHKRPGVGSLPSSIISKKNFFADAISARTFAFVISAFAMLSSPLMFAQTVSPAPTAITNSHKHLTWLELEFILTDWSCDGDFEDINN